MIEMTIKQYKRHIREHGGGNNKYGAKKTYCKAKHLHDSGKEATRCDQLNLLRKGGIITCLKQQPRFVLLKGFWYRHDKIRPICYFADFSYKEEGVLVIEDVKGRLTDVYKMKKKMLLDKIKNRKKCKFIET